MDELFTKYTFNGLTYFVSTKGRIFGCKVGELKQRVGMDGYMFVTLGSFYNKRTSTCVHRIVADAFIGRPSKEYEVNHIDFNRTNNNVENLEYLTHTENIQHSSLNASNTGSRSGTKNGRSILNYSKAEDIRHKYSCGHKISHIAKEYGVGWTTVSHIIKNETWIVDI